MNRPLVEWRCHICGDFRPDEKISVLTKPLNPDCPEIGDQNIRYCNDRMACEQGAKHFTFLSKKEKTGDS